MLEIYATSIDYDPREEILVLFFKKVQNKIHYAIHGQTAAEVIGKRADAEREFTRLTTFAGSQPTLKEAVIAKKTIWMKRNYVLWSNWCLVIWTLQSVWLSVSRP